MKTFVKIIMFFGPSGILFISFLGLGSFRLFYILCFLFNIIFLFKLNIKKNVLVGCLLLSTISLMSAAFGFFSTTEEMSLAENPVVRVCIIANLLFSFTLMYTQVIVKMRPDEVVALYKISSRGMLLTYAVGLLFYGMALIGVQSNIYSSIVTQEQDAYGFLRFSPGTYPNEFGVLCSFYAILSIILFVFENKKHHLLMSVIYLIGIALASTRAAYLTFLLSFLPLVYYYGKKRRFVVVLCGVFIAVWLALAILNYFGFDFIQILISGIDALENKDSSAYQRIYDYAVAYEKFMKTPWLGLGAENINIAMIHNLYLQTFYGYGIFLFVIIGIICVILFLSCQEDFLNSRLYKKLKENTRVSVFLRSICFVLFIHVAIFGATNHNQAHFLTWVLWGNVCTFYALFYKIKGR